MATNPIIESRISRAELRLTAIEQQLARSTRDDLAALRQHADQTLETKVQNLETKVARLSDLLVKVEHDVVLYRCEQMSLLQTMLVDSSRRSWLSRLR